MRALLNKTVLVASILSSALLQACATGQGTSFATRVGSGSAPDSFSEQAGSSDEDASFSEPIVLASSGNVLLPGAFTNTPGLAGLAGYDLLPGINPESGLGGNGLNGAFGGAITLQRNDGDAPQVTVNGGLDVASLGTPGAALSPLISATQGATPGVPNILLGGNGSSLASAGPAGVSVAGRPLASVGGVGSVLSGSGAVAGVAGGAGNIVSGTNPGSAASQVVNAAAGVTAAVISMPPSAGSPPPAAGTPPVSGLGGLTGMLPPLLR